MMRDAKVVLDREQSIAAGFPVWGITWTDQDGDHAATVSLRDMLPYAVETRSQERGLATLELSDYLLRPDGLLAELLQKPLPKKGK